MAGQRLRAMGETRSCFPLAPFTLEKRFVDNVAAVRAPLSVVLIVKNEQDRLPEALESVDFADEIVVADTGSTDETARVARLGGARVASIGWEGFVASRNRALAEARHDWVLVLDADERVSPALRDEILAALEKDDPAISGYRMPRLSHFLGRAIRHGTWYPDYKLRLGRRSRGLRAEGGRVHEVMVVDGAMERLVDAAHPSPLPRPLRRAPKGVDVRAARRARPLRPRRPRERDGTFSPAARRVLPLPRSPGGVSGRSRRVPRCVSPRVIVFLRAAFLLEIQRRPPVEQKRAPEGDPDMKLTMGHSFGGAFALAAASVLVLGGCAKTEEKGPMEKAGAAADKAVEKVRDASKEAAKSVSEAAATAAASVSQAAEKAKAGAAEMTATAGAAVEKAGQKVGAAAEKSAEKVKTAASTAATPKK